MRWGGGADLFDTSLIINPCSGNVFRYLFYEESSHAGFVTWRQRDDAPEGGYFRTEARGVRTLERFDILVVSVLRGAQRMGRPYANPLPVVAIVFRR